MITVESVQRFNGLGVAPKPIPGPLDTLWAAITKPFQGTPSIGSPAGASSSARSSSSPVVTSTVDDDYFNSVIRVDDRKYSPHPTVTQAVMRNLSRTGGGASGNTATLKPGAPPVVTSTVDEDYFNEAADRARLVPARSGPVQQSVEEGGVGILPAIAAITSAIAPVAAGMISQKREETAARRQARADAANAAAQAKTRQVVVRQQPFPWKPVLIGTGVAVGLGIGGYLLVKAASGGGRRRNPRRRSRR